MRARLTGRVGKVRERVPAGCASCRRWPLVRYWMDGDPEAPTVCEACGREWHGLT